jgi:hypothetical protein
MPEKLDWSKLPPELGWLAVSAERYGRLQFDDPIYDFLRGLNSTERDQLRELGQRWGEAFPEIDAWLDQYTITVHPEASLVYFTLYLLGTGADAGLL